MPVSLSLKGKVAMVTGASRKIGIGAAVCRLLAEAGADVFFTYFTSYDQQRPWGIHPDEPDELLQSLRASGIRVEAKEADLSDPATPAHLFDKAEASLGPVHILVNNATYDDESGLDQFSADTLDRHYAVNVRGAALLCMEYARRFPGGEGGRIINLVSGELLHPMADNLPYAITKGAVDALTITLSSSLASRHITVNAVDPGPTDTGWMKPQVKQWLVEQAPFGRVGMPSDVANLILFLASPQGGWITGQILHSRGGF